MLVFGSVTSGFARSVQCPVSCMYMYINPHNFFAAEPEILLVLCAVQNFSCSCLLYIFNKMRKVTQTEHTLYYMLYSIQILYTARHTGHTMLLYIHISYTDLNHSQCNSYSIHSHYNSSSFSFSTPCATFVWLFPLTFYLYVGRVAHSV